MLDRWGEVGENGSKGGDRPLETTSMDPVQHSSLYVGQYQHSLDAKGRLTVPSKWRFKGDEGDATYLALPNADGSVIVYSPAQVARLKEKIAQVGLLGNPQQLRVIQQIFSQGEQFGPDKQGRIGLSDKLIKHTGIKKDAVLVGLVNNFVIWSTERYERQGKAEQDAAALTATLKDLGL